MNVDITMEFSIMLYILAVLTGTTNSRSCMESSNTYKVVNSCPTTETEVKERARIKGCDSLAKSQNCSAPSKFKYHCVINSIETALIEVCAPVYFILGYCAEYNYQGARIQDHYHRRCTNYSQPCPTRYISTDAYKFPGCYEVGKTQENLTSIIENQTSSASISAMVAIGVVVVMLAALLFMYCCIKYCSRTKDPGQQKKENENASTSRLMHSSRDIDGGRPSTALMRGNMGFFSSVDLLLGQRPSDDLQNHLPNHSLHSAFNKVTQ